MEEPKVDLETATADFLRMAKFARVKLDAVRSTVDKQDLESVQRRMVEMIMDGRIEVDEMGRPTIVTESTETPRLTVTRKGGAILKAGDLHKKENEMAKTGAMAAEMFGVSAARIWALDSPDTLLVFEILGFFLAY